MIYHRHLFPDPAQRHITSILSGPSGQEVGTRITGGYAGPALLVSGDAGIMDRVTLRLAALPSLPWMRGEMMLISSEHLDCALSNGLDRDVQLDIAAADCDGVPGQAYWIILRRCAELGMISGRGVRRWKMPAQPDQSLTA